MRTRSRFMLVPVCLLAFPPVGAATRESGDKRTDQVIESIEKSVKEMRESRKRVEKALDAYHDVLSKKQGDRRSSYEELVKGLDNVEERCRELQKRFQEMDKAAGKYFNGWEKSLEEIQSGDLRRRGASRLDGIRSRYQALLKAGGEVQNAFATVLDRLEDQVVYLEHDLNSSAASSLEVDKRAIAEEARGLLARIESYAALANDYVDSLQPD